ncbi:hypothetical protein C8R43DRAFT_955253 [Mycena crocata]|nr:hypothetical protein C8R43DRAFT_955253 [Mycena crocata]
MARALKAMIPSASQMVLMWSAPQQITSCSRNSYKLKTLEGFPIGGQVSTWNLRQFVLRRSTMLHALQEEWMTGLEELGREDVEEADKEERVAETRCRRCFKGGGTCTSGTGECAVQAVRWRSFHSLAFTTTSVPAVLPFHRSADLIRPDRDLAHLLSPADADKHVSTLTLPHLSESLMSVMQWPVAGYLAGVARDGGGVSRPSATKVTMGPGNVPDSNGRVVGEYRGRALKIGATINTSTNCPTWLTELKFECGEPEESEAEVDLSSG